MYVGGPGIDYVLADLLLVYDGIHYLHKFNFRINYQLGKLEKSFLQNGDICIVAAQAICRSSNIHFETITT